MVFWKYRKFIWHNSWKDLRHRYAGSSMGFMWNVLHPLAQILIYTIVFSQMMRTRIPNIHSSFGFAIYLCSGLIPWLGFNETLIRCTNSFVENANYLRKLPIPEQIFVIQNAATSFLSLLISMALLFATCLLLGHYPTWPWLAIPLVLLLLESFSFGLGLFLGVLNVFFRDISQATMLFLQVWFWLTPIVYVSDVLPASVRGWLFLNPLYPFIDSMHRIIIAQTWPPAGLVAAMMVIALLFPILGYLTLARLRSQIRDVI